MSEISAYCVRILKTSLLIFLSIFILLVPGVRALSQSDIDAIYGDSTFYDPNACSSSTPSGAVSGIGTQSGSWNSGKQPPYVLQEFMIEVLKDLAAKLGTAQSDAVTSEHVLALIAFAQGEGGDITNGSVFNPLNNGGNFPELLDGPHSASGNQKFKSFDAGVEATARALSDGNHTRLSAALTDPKVTADQFMYALTYYQNYPGNAIWAAASMPPHQDEYYRDRLALVQTARSHYMDLASLIIGTPAQEETENLHDTSKVDTSLVPQGSSTSTGGINNSNGTSSGGCSTPSAAANGAYKNPFRDIQDPRPSRIDEGVDYNGSGPVYALGNGTIVGTYYNFFKGEPDIIYTLSDGPAAGKTVYFAECITTLPNIQPGVSVTSDTVIANMNASLSSSCHSGTEMGWANASSLPDPMAATSGYRQHDGYETAFGLNFNDLLVKLGAQPGHLDTKNDPSGIVLGSLPAGWPTWQ